MIVIELPIWCCFECGDRYAMLVIKNKEVKIEHDHGYYVKCKNKDQIFVRPIEDFYTSVFND